MDETWKIWGYKLLGVLSQHLSAWLESRLLCSVPTMAIQQNNEVLLSDQLHSSQQLIAQGLHDLSLSLMYEGIPPL